MLQQKAEIQELTNRELWIAIRPGNSSWHRANFQHIKRGFCELLLRRGLHLPRMYGSLWLSIGDQNLGLVSLQKITTVGVAFIVDALQNITELDLIRYHAWGIGGGTEQISDTQLGTELTTQITPPNLRTTGSLLEGTAPNIFKTVGLTLINTGVTLQEFGIFTSVSVGSPVLIDRTVFAVRAVSANLTITSRYLLTVPAGG